MRTFVIGDIHGWAERLDRLLALLEPRAFLGDTLVFLGDYVDRGLDSRAVVDRILAVRETWPGPVVALRGNHEARMLEALASVSVANFANWLYYYQAKGTVGSYTPVISLSAFQASLPPAHQEFFGDLPLWYEDEHAIYVHAGLRPLHSPGECTEEDLLWIREEFLESDYVWPKPVVFGHTPQFALVPIETPAAPSPTPPTSLVARHNQVVWRPLNRPEKIGIDTGCGHGGLLTAVILPEREFLSVGG